MLASEYVVVDRAVPVEGGEVLARIVTPKDIDGTQAATYPLMVWFHGGGTRTFTQLEHSY